MTKKEMRREIVTVHYLPYLVTVYVVESFNLEKHVYVSHFLHKLCWRYSFLCWLIMSHYEQRATVPAICIQGFHSS